MRQHRRTGAVHGGTSSAFDRLQIHAADLPQTGEDDLQQRLYFTGNLFLDGFDRFFSCPLVAAPGTGRRRQIFSLTSNRARVSC